MADLLESFVCHSLDEAVVLLKEQLSGISENPESALEELQGRKVLRVEIPIAEGIVDPLAYLRSCACEQKFYWRDRDDKTETAVVGIAEKFSLDSSNDFGSLFMAVQSRLAGSPDSVRFWGGFRFDPERVDWDVCWESFGRGQLVLPRLEIQRRDDGCVFACNILAEEIRNLSEAEYSRWFFSDTENHVSPETKSTRERQRTDFPKREDWESNVAFTVDLIKKGEIDKLVLSRKSTIDMIAPVDPWEILSKLRESSQSCFLFGISPSSDVTFVGATPEQLYYRNGDHVFSEAIAGTRARGADRDQDEQLADDLCRSEKDKREHQFVVDGIEQSLRTVCDSLTVSAESTLLKLSRVQHLLTRFEGDIRQVVSDSNSGNSDSEIFRALHPTPAVGGFPREKVLEKIHQLEPFDRGWYTGPVGYVSSSSAKFAVAIRCALVSSDSLSLFSGAGLVAGSDPGEEWQEIEDKISNFLSVIGL